MTEPRANPEFSSGTLVPGGCRFIDYARTYIGGFKGAALLRPPNVNVNVNVEFKVTLHEQVRCRGTLHLFFVFFATTFCGEIKLCIKSSTVCHTAGHYGEENDD